MSKYGQKICTQAAPVTLALLTLPLSLFNQTEQKPVSQFLRFGSEAHELLMTQVGDNDESDVKRRFAEAAERRNIRLSRRDTIQQTVTALAMETPPTSPSDSKQDVTVRLSRSGCWLSLLGGSISNCSGC